MCVCACVRACVSVCSCLYILCLRASAGVYVRRVLNVNYEKVGHTHKVGHLQIKC